MKQQTKVSDDELKAYYQQNIDQFKVQNRVHVEHILFKTVGKTDAEVAEIQKTAEGVLKKVKSGGNFEELAKQYSEDPGSKDKGGEYTFPRGRMVPEFEAAAFSLKTNQISEIVETQYGYHIIKLLEKYPAKKDQFAEVEPRIKEYLVGKEAEKSLPAYLDRIKAEAGVKLIDPDTGKPVPPAAK